MAKKIEIKTVALPKHVITWLLHTCDVITLREISEFANNETRELAKAEIDRRYNIRHNPEPKCS